MRAIYTAPVALLACFAFSSAYGAIVVTESDQLSVPYAVTPHEINLGITGVVSGTALQGKEGTSADPSVLSNGTNGAGNFSDYATQVVSINDGTNITYNFATPQAINSIYTYSEWRDYGRINQDYTVSYSTDGVNFTPLTTVAYDNPANVGTLPATNQGLDAEVAITGFSLSGVKAIEFSFPSTQNGYVGYTELSINNTPEPSALIALAGLAGMGLIGLAWRRRRAA